MKSLSQKKPYLIIMVGIPGAGKTFFAEQFARTFKAPFISSEKLRYELFDTPDYSQAEDETIFKVCDYILEEFFKTGKMAIYEGRADSRADRVNIARKARAFGYEPLLVWVQTESTTAQKRAIKSQSEKPSITLDQFNDRLSRFKAPHQTEKIIVISGKHTFSSQLKIVLKKLVDPRMQSPSRKVPIRRNTVRNILIR